MNGGWGDDEIIGDGYDNVISGCGGADVLDGGGGFDTLDYSHSTNAVQVSLATGLGAGGHAQGDRFIGFEAVVGSRYADRITGGDGDDFIEGGEGGDELDGGGGVDTVSYRNAVKGVTIDLLQGREGNGGFSSDKLTGFENIQGSAHADVLYGDDGDNVLEGGAGADRLFGRKGSDTASYAGSNAGVIVDLAAGACRGGHAEGDELTGIENLLGSAWSDQLTGDAGSNLLYGRAGDDVLVGGAGADELHGEDGFDTADYSGSGAAVAVRLKFGTGQGGDAEGDRLSGIERVVGSAFHDTLVGSLGADVLEGGAGKDYLDGLAGNDRLDGGAGADRLKGGAGDDWLVGGAGADLLDGGGGIDTADYSGSAKGVTVRLKAGTGEGSDAAGDVLISVENLVGSAKADRLIGSKAANRLEGGRGQDYLDGLEGDDWLDGGAGADRLKGGAGDDVLVGGAGADELDGGEGFDRADYSGSAAGVTVDLAAGTGLGGEAQGDVLTGIEAVTGSAFADRLTGDAGANRLEGGAGNDVIVGGAGADVLDGGAGVDTVSYAGSTAGVAVRLKFGTGQGGDAEGDVLSGFENVDGSALADTLVGDDGGNRLNGGAGDDYLDGLGGDDVIVGGGGNDRLKGGAGADLFVFAGRHGRDRVLDFDGAAGDRLRLDAYADFAELLAHAADGAEGVVIARGAEAVTLVGVTRAQLQGGWFELKGAGVPALAETPAAPGPEAGVKTGPEPWAQPWSEPRLAPETAPDTASAPAAWAPADLAAHDLRDLAWNPRAQPQDWDWIA